MIEYDGIPQSKAIATVTYIPDEDKKWYASLEKKQGKALVKELWKAVQAKSASRVKLLCDLPASKNMNIETSNNKALWLAIKNDSVEIAKCLLKRGANANDYIYHEFLSNDYFLKTALMSDKEDMACVLLKHNARPNHPDNGENLRGALEKGFVQATSLIIENGGSIDGYASGKAINLSSKAEIYRCASKANSPEIITYLDELYKKLEAKAEEEAKKEEKLESYKFDVDDTSEFHIVDNTSVAQIQIIPGPTQTVLRTVFNFKSKRVITHGAEIETGLGAAMIIESFKDMQDELMLNEAYEFLASKVKNPPLYKGKDNVVVDKSDKVKPTPPSQKVSV